MSENNKGRYVQISNFRNIGVSEKEQSICINRSIDDDYIGNLVLLIGPNNSGKTNILNALNILNKGVSFKPSDLPNTISNPNEKTYIKLFDDIDSMNILLTKFANEENEKSKITFKQWKGQIKDRINKFLTSHMNNCGYQNLKDFTKSKNVKVNWANRKYEKIVDFYAAVGSWKIEQFTKNQSWKTNLGKISLTKKGNSNFNNPICEESILNKKLIDELNQIISPNSSNMENNQPSSNNNAYKFLKYEDWKINNSFFKVKYSEPWNPFFVNLLTEINIKQSEIKNGIGNKRLYYNNKVEQGLKRINANFNNLFKVNGYVYKFDLFFSDESISFEINLVSQDSNDNNENQIIPLDFEEQSTGFKYFFNLYFGLLIGQNEKLKKGDIVLMDEPGSNLHVEGIIELRNILKQFTQNTGISIILSTHSPFLVDFDYLDEIRLVDRIGGIVDINNNFQFNKEGSSNSLKSITNALATYPNSLIKYNDPIFILVEGITDYNYLTGYKVYKINQINKKISESLPNTEKSELEKLLHQYAVLTFVPFNGLGKNEDDFEHLFKSIDDEYHQHKYKFLIDGDDKGEAFKNKFANQTINLTELVNDFNNIEVKNRIIESLIAEDDKQNFGLMIGNKIEKHSNNSATFKYAMVKGNASEQTYQNFDKLFTSLIKELNNK